MPLTLDCAVAVITVSDRRAAGSEPDATGPTLAAAMEQLGATVSRTVVADGIDTVRHAISAAVESGHAIVLTTGGTGVSPRDLTPEATAPLLAQRLEGIPELLRRAGADHSPFAAISRGLAGITAAPRRALVVNLPGSPGGVRDGVAVLSPLLPHLISQLEGADH